jgi:DNA-binding transcriptional LysR family regulator
MSFHPAEVLSRWDDIRSLLAVLRAGSFTQAAKALKTEQSTVSRRIGALEEELGVVLFERSARAPTPTQTAIALREIAETVEMEVGRFTDIATEESRQLVRGRVRLALTEEMATHFVVPHVLPRLAREFPELRVDLVTSYGASDLMGHEADVALRFFRSDRGDLVGRRLGHLPTAILCHKSLRRRLGRKHPGDLPWVVVDLPGMPTLETRWLARNLSTSPVLSCTSYQVQLAAIRAKLGVGIGPAIVPRLDPELTTIAATDFQLPSLELFLFTRRAIQKLPRIRALMEALEQGLGPFVERT